MEFNPTKATVHNEDCDLHYWHQGSGPLIVFIPGGNGHGRRTSIRVVHSPFQAVLGV